MIVEIHIGKGCEQTIDQQAVGGSGMTSLGPGGLCQLNQFLNQLVLQLGGGWLFSADPGIYTGFISGDLLALKTKHI